MTHQQLRPVRIFFVKEDCKMFYILMILILVMIRKVIKNYNKVIDLPTEWAMWLSCPREDLCFSFLLRSVRLPALTMNAILTSSSPLDLFFSFPGLLFRVYHLHQSEISFSAHALSFGNGVICIEWSQPACTLPVAWSLVHIEIRQWDASHAEKFIHAQKVPVQGRQHDLCRVPMLWDWAVQIIKQRWATISFES
jgi:hypothetical protein